MALAATMLLAQPAAAGWLQARSKHFIIYSQGSESNLREFATRIEALDASLRSLSNKPDREGIESNPVTIFIVPSINAVRSLYGDQRSQVAGFYVPRVEGSVAFTPARTDEGAGIDREDNPFSPSVVLFHEYGHHFLLGNFSIAYPSWFSEGYAEVVSTAAFNKEKNEVVLGGAANHRAYSLFRGKTLSMEQLLASSQQRMTDDQVADLYARGWLITHYLMFNSERAKKFSTYIKALNSGTPSIEAARTAFGDLKALDKDLQRYMANRLPGFRITLKAGEIPAITIQPLSEGADAMMASRMRSTRGVDSDRAAKVFAQGKQVGARYPDDPVVQAWLAEMAYDAGDDAAAEAAADRALASDPKSIQALSYKGRVLLRRAEKAKADAKTWATARSWIVKANRVDPNVAATLALFYGSFLMQDIKPSASAVAGLERAFELVPQDPGLRFMLVRQEIEDNKIDLARDLLAPLAYDPHASGDSPVGKLLADLKAGKQGQEALDAFDAAITQQSKASEGKKD
ncbi:hypothetical protein [Sphingomonas alpina]|uniref:DUF1570 domain-containing protein n=1 Tax=Sphingomonas alpina TaxID=653931 RepID=A0A7H0LDS0_9SPHN|nr:hypothetical protein [Sphingomonas alpina]QNQ07823.1 hypothetical protein H3Z74_13525 [Sphingomonas alpina]